MFDRIIMNVINMALKATISKGRRDIVFAMASLRKCMKSSIILVSTYES